MNSIKIKITSLFWTFVIMSSVLANAQKHTISGYIVDDASGETLIGALAYESNTYSTATTNSYGFFSLTLPEGNHNVKFSYVGYQDTERNFNLISDTIITIRMKSATTLDDVVVTAMNHKTGINATAMGAVDIPVSQIEHTPGLLGEADLMRTIQLQPGVQSGLGGSTGLYVRGGSGDENLIMLDDVPLYKVDHLFGFFSVFNPEAIKKVTFYKSSFPALYTGRLSSVIDVRTNDGDMNNYHASASIGLVSAKVNVEGPVVKGKTSFNLSARRTYIDYLMAPFMDNELDFRYKFYDINAKVNHIFSDRDRIYLSFYRGRDYLKETYTDEWYDDDKDNDGLKMIWGNTVVAARWNHVFGEKLFANVTAAYNNYDMNITTFNENISTSYYEHEKYHYRSYNDSKFVSRIRDWSASVDFDYTPTPANKVKFGGKYIYHDFSPQGISGKNEEFYTSESGKTIPDVGFETADTLISQQRPHIFASEAMLYAEDDIRINNYWNFDAGLAVSLFHVQGKTNIDVQPRASLRWQPVDSWVFKASYSRTSQYIHLLTSMPISMPTDIWVPITKNIKPMYANQYSAGVYYTGINGWTFGTEVYYKGMNNVLEYKDGMSMLGFSNGWENLVSAGKGRAYGLELMAEKRYGDNTYLFAYTLSKSERRFDRNSGVNAGEWFPYTYDRRHVINAAYNHKFSKRCDLDATWMFYTGGTATVASKKQMVIEPNGKISEKAYVTNRNNYRLPPSHTLCVGMNFRKNLKNNVLRTWNISVYNLYNAMNPTFVFMDEEDFEKGRHLKKLTLLPCIPSFSLTYKF